MAVFNRHHYLPYFLLSLGIWAVWSVFMLYNPEISTTESYSRGIVRIQALLLPSLLFLFFNPEFSQERNPLLPLLVGSLIGFAFYLFHVIADAIPENATLPTSGAIWLNWIIGSPLVEEVFFRGIVLKQELKSKPWWLAILISAICFTLFHLPSWIIVQHQAPMELLQNASSILVYGIVFGLIYWLSKSIWATFMPHAANNLIAIIVKHFQKKRSTTPNTMHCS